MMFNRAIGALSDKEVLKTSTPTGPGATPMTPDRSLSEQDFSEPEPEGREEVFLNAPPAKPVDVKITAGGASLHVKNPA